MKAIVCPKYGSPDVLQLREVEKPTPKDNEVLIKVYAASVTAADGMMRRGSPVYARLLLGLMRPKRPIPGTGFSGVVEAVGQEVARFKEGDPVFGETGLGFGANAEWVCLPETGVLAAKPTQMTHEQAAPVCDGALTSLNFLKEIGNVQSGQSVLINGASGSLGTAAVQLAKHLGAGVTGVCSGANVELVKALGADRVIDYTKEDFTKAGQAYDVVFDTVGRSSFPRCKGALKPHGVYLSPVLSLPLLLQTMWTTRSDGPKAKATSPARPRTRPAPA